MGATQLSLPDFRRDMFEFGEREVPRHGNRKPPSHNGRSWGLRGILAPHLGGETVLATNVTDRNTLLFLVDARLRHLEDEFGIKASGEEVRFHTPQDAAQGLYGPGPGTGLEIADGESAQQVFERAGQILGVSSPSPVMESIVESGISLVPAMATPEAIAA